MKAPPADGWLAPALDYIPRWLDLQVRNAQQPGCIVAVAHRGAVAREWAFGSADLARGQALTPRHRFRVASHTKSFTAAGVMLLREQGRLRLDDAVGAYVDGLHPALARATLGQLLSHSAGATRDGADAGQFVERRPFLSRAELMADLRAAPPIEAGARMKYSNHGYALLGLVIEVVTGTPYAHWMRDAVIGPAGLRETLTDAPLPARTPFARGHTARWPAGERFVVAGDTSTEAIGPAAGIVSTAADLARFYASLDPAAADSLLSAASRREMTRAHWRVPHASVESHYGLGVMSGTIGGWPWFGHSGGLLGYISRTAALPGRGIAVSVLTNAVDGWAWFWLDGIVHILRAFAERGAPARRLAGWDGRWWSAWGAVDLVAMGGRVLAANPHLFNPFMDVAEIEVSGRDRGRIAVANGLSSHGEPVRRERDARGSVAAVWLGGSMLRPEARVAADLRRRYAAAGSAGLRRLGARRTRGDAV